MAIGKAKWDEIFGQIEDLDDELFEKAIQEEKVSSSEAWVRFKPDCKYSQQDKDMLDVLKKELKAVFQPAKVEEDKKKKIGYSFFYRECCRNYYNEYVNDKSGLRAFIKKAWSATEGSFRESMHRDYYENADVWLSEYYFWRKYTFPEFAEKYYCGDDEWENSWGTTSREIFRYSDDDFLSSNFKSYKFKQIILTASKLEHAVVSRFLQRLPHIGRIKRFDLDGICRCEMITIRDHFHILHVAANNMGSFTEQGSRRALDKIFRSNRNSDCVTSLGICYGINAREYNLGDVMVSDRMISHHTYKRKGNDIDFLDDTCYRTHDSLDLYWREQKGKKKYAYGAILSGGAVLSDASEKNRIMVSCMKKYGVSPIAGEMEGDGMYRACHKPIVALSNSKREYPCIIIKGVCDWGAMKNCWDLIAADQYEEDYEEYRNEYDNPVGKNDVIKNSVQSFGVHNALGVWGEYFMKKYEKVLSKEMIVIKKVLDDLENGLFS